MCYEYYPAVNWDFSKLREGLQKKYGDAPPYRFKFVLNFPPFSGKKLKIENSLKNIPKYTAGNYLDNKLW